MLKLKYLVVELFVKFEHLMFVSIHMFVYILRVFIFCILNPIPNQESLGGLERDVSPPLGETTC